MGQKISLPRETSLERLVRAYGVHLIRDGQDWKGHCPFHFDTDFSLIINPDQNHWQCTGACQTGGFVVEWIMKTEGVTKSHATELLQNNYQPGSGVERVPVQELSVRRLDAPFSSEESDQNILQHVVHHYHEVLKQSPKILISLQKLGINGEALEQFKLGFSDRSLGCRLPEKNRKEGAALRGRLQRLGILKSSGHELFHGSLIVPLTDNGIIKQIYGHKITKRLRPGTPVESFLPVDHSGFFNTEAVNICEELILCQNIIDALTFWCAGYKNVTCSYGIKNTQDKHHLEQLKSSPVKRVLLAYAGNKAGDMEANALAEQLTDLGIDSYRIEFTKGMDANKYARSHQPASKSLGDVIRKAAWLGKEKPSQTITTGESHLGASDDAVGSNRGRDLDLRLETEISTKDGSSIAESCVNDSDMADNTEYEVPLPATVLPPSAIDVEAEVKDGEVVMYFDERRYRIRGLERNLTAEQLKVNILISQDNNLHVDTFDLYGSRVRLSFIKQTAIELGVSEKVIKKDLGKLLLKLEVLQDKHIRDALTPKTEEITLTKQEKTEALGLLRSPELFRRILEDFSICGMVGEKTNILVGFLAALSRKLDNPLAVIIQSTSAAGKSALMDAVLSFIPEEDRVQYSAMTGQSLFYMGDINLRHKILAISEEEGASQATYALKLLQSEGQLTIASTGKDPNSGRHVTCEYKVQGPVMIFSTTTAIDIDEELLNRCLVLTVDEDRAQTQAIHDHQRYEETLEGLLSTQHRNDILRVHRNAQRLLKPLKVVNPYAPQLTFLNDKTRTRRDHKKYLTLIRSIALLHQYQREVKSTYCDGKQISYVEVTLNDIELANNLAHEVLGRSLDDIPPQTRRLLSKIDTMVNEHCQEQAVTRSHYQFTRRTIREYTGWGGTQLKVHLKRLESMEYLLIRRGGRASRIVYELLYNREGQDGMPFMMGLIDVNTLKEKTETKKRSGVNDNLSGSSRPQVGVVSASYRGDKKNVRASKDKALGEWDDEIELSADQNIILTQDRNVPLSNQTPGV